MHRRRKGQEPLPKPLLDFKEVRHSDIIHLDADSGQARRIAEFEGRTMPGDYSAEG